MIRIHGHAAGISERGDLQRLLREQVEVISPIKCPGKLNLWRVDQELRDQVNSQLSGADAPVRIGPN